MTNKELDEGLRVLAFFLKVQDNQDWGPQIELCKAAAARIRDYTGKTPIAYLREHDDRCPKGMISMTPLTSHELFEGWTETELYSHPVKPDASAQFGPGQSAGWVL